MNGNEKVKVVSTTYSEYEYDKDFKEDRHNCSTCAHTSHKGDLRCINTCIRTVKLSDGKIFQGTCAVLEADVYIAEKNKGEL